MIIYIYIYMEFRNIGIYNIPHIIHKKLCLIGNYNVGKTSLINKYATNTFNENTISTIGVSFNSTYFYSKDYKIKLELWDTAGSERFETIIPIYLRNADIILLVYDVTESNSINSIQKWLKIINRTIDLQNSRTEIILVGNKVDLLDNDMEQLKAYIDEIKYLNFNVSCKTGYNVIELFDKIKEIIINQNDQTQSQSLISISDREILSLDTTKRCC